MIYLESFKVPWVKASAAYPFNVLAPLRLDNISFDHITIFYGSNGCGKSTLLNIIARKLSLQMDDHGNDGVYLQKVIDGCRADYDWRLSEGVPPESRFIRSEDVMHAIVRLRKKNEAVKTHIRETRPDLYERFFLSDPSEPKGYVWSEDSWIFGALENFDASRSNGEMAYDYFQDHIDVDSLVILDEPENSLSPKYQRKLAEMLGTYARYFNCQFIIASHSPFMLSIPGAKVYNLDEHPAAVRRWYELENMQAYIDLFRKYLPHDE